MRWLLPPWSAFMLFERERARGWVEMRTWPREYGEVGYTFRIPNRQEMPGSSEQDRQLRDQCISRPLPRWHDPDPLGGLSSAYISEILKGRRGGARAMYVSGAVGRSRGTTHGYHCFGRLLGRSIQGSAHQLVQLLCHHCTVSSRLRCTKRAGHGRPPRGRPRARTGHKTVLKHL
jgi:hypothetical protein